MSVVRTVVCALVLTAVAVPAAAVQVRDGAPQPTARRGTAVLAGSIVSDEETPRPIRRATVTITEDGGQASGRTAVTDDAGHFVVAGLPAGRYRVTASKGAYLPAAFGATRSVRPGNVSTGTPIALADGQRLTDLVVRMMRGGVLTGVIRDESGRPARGINMMLSYLARSPQSGERVLVRLPNAEGTSRTDSRGEYRIYGLAPGDYVVSALPSPFEPATDLTITTALDLARVSGAAGASPAPSSPLPRMGFVPVHFPGTTQAGDAAPIRLAPGEERAGLDFALQLVTNARVDGVVVGADGRPVPSMVVTAHSNAGAAPLNTGRAVAQTDPKGQFSLRGLPPGAYTISGSTRDGHWGATPVHVQGDDLRANIQLRPGVPFVGSVRAGDTAGAPPDLTRMRVQLVAESSALPLPNGGYVIPVAADGRFTAAVLPGRYRLLLSTTQAPAAAAPWTILTAQSGAVDVADRPFEIREGAPMPDIQVTVTNRGAEIAGRMIDAAGRAAPEYFVIVFPADSADWGWRARRIQQTRPGHDGAFSVSGLPPGEYRIAAVRDVDQNEWFDPEFLTGLVEASIRVTLAAGARVVQTIQVK